MKRYKKFFFSLIILNIIFTAIVIYICFSFYKVINADNSVIDKSVKNLTENSGNQSKEIDKIKRDILFLDEGIKSNSVLINDIKASNYGNDIALVKAKVDNLINSKPEEEKLKFTIIKTLNTILKKYYNNQKFDQEIDSLKILCKNNDLVLNDIKQLENFLNINSKLLLDTFDTESKNLIVNSENSILKNLIKIKKISDKNTLKTTNSTIKNIRSSIINNDLQLATDLIINNNYQDKLAKTLELIQENQRFLVLLNSIIQNI